MDDDNRILQIMPAEGWFAVFHGEQDEEDELSAVVCFALVESGQADAGKRTVRPMTDFEGEVDFCDNAESYVGLVRADESELGDD